MTKPGEQPSTFDARADSAAQALRKGLQRQGREVPDSAPVEVDARGNPPPLPPPAGSYAAQAQELRKRQAAQAQPPQRAEDGLQEEPPEPEATPQPAATPNSPRAEQRIQELVAQLREKEQQLQEAMEMGRKATETATQFQSRLQTLEQQHQQMLERNLETLDPETRQQVLTDARMQQAMAGMEERILGKIAPTLTHLRQSEAQRELQALASKYPGFDIHVHAPLIDRFRAKNPHCSIEQAFRAIAEPEELGVRKAARATAIPPTIPPGNGSAGAPRFTPPVQRQTNPDDELVEESRRIKELRASTDPNKQKEGLNLVTEHLKRRLGGS